MNFTNFTNRDLMSMLANVASIFRSRPVDSEKITEDYIGLAVAKSYFYGIKKPDGNYQALELSKVVFNNKSDVTLQIEGIVKLEVIPVNIGAGDIVYDGLGVLLVNNVVIYDGRTAKFVTSDTFQDVLTATTAPVTVPVNLNMDITTSISYQEHPVFVPGDKYLYMNLEGLNTTEVVECAKLIINPEKNDLPAGHIALTPSTLLVVPEANTLEYDGTNLYMTDSTSTRKQIAYVV